ncbi:ATP-binding protein [Kineothrix sp. MB12-C1]|uniref:ATP-binding protein n=1 Tax=Kineothrix sp. MB12-C1 TaxID=3070215 RepID=UPI0027D24429|nr:4Fe-4S dicluster domain-containing protein [Kineothrix sp. MB12-C1]WMC91061.1 4Fe-4S dicluster domain-containing protein [Kineothrix sp. MB12-C1]
MKRTIIKIDADKCNGCGACISACHEDAIIMVDGKATLLRDDYCDGLGNCLPACPTDAISFEEREAAPFDEEAVKRNQALKAAQNSMPSGCPGTRTRMIERTSVNKEVEASTHKSEDIGSELMQWPVQIQLVPINAPYFDNANLLIAADCTAFAYGNFHREFIKNHVTVIGCPKLDMIDYSEKLTEIIRNNNIKSVKIIRMEVPCCGGIEAAAKQALQASGKFIPWQVVTVGTDGELLA